MSGTATPLPERRQRFEVVAAEVFEPLQRYLRRRARAEDAEDALADVMLTIWRRLEDVPSENPLPWCYGVARLTLANQRRGAGRRARLLGRLAAERPVPTLGDSADPEMEIALAALSVTEREILRLWAWEQLEPREIAEVLSVSANAVSLRLGRARRRLEEELVRQNHPLAGQDDSHGGKESW